MSIATKTGDTGTTALMFNRRVSKCHPRVEACGNVDELSSALGVARASTDNAFFQATLEDIQKDLIGLMGELATLETDMEIYIKSGFPRIDTRQTEKLDALVQQLEREQHFEGWALSGANALGAHIDLARTICRRAERGICSLADNGTMGNMSIIIYLNRLGDVLWLLARKAEHTA